MVLQVLDCNSHYSWLGLIGVASLTTSGVSLSVLEWPRRGSANERTAQSLGSAPDLGIALAEDTGAQ